MKVLGFLLILAGCLVWPPLGAILLVLVGIAALGR